MSENKKIPVIVFAGGSHSGKSTTLVELRKLMNPEYRVAFAPEIATAVFSGRPGDDVAGENVYYRQTYITRVQLLIEELLRDGKPDVIIFDRGISDMHTYVSEDECAKILEYLHMTNDDLNSHYDLVLYFETIIGDPNDDRDTLRIENNIEDIKRNSERARRSWEHNCHMVHIPVMGIGERTALVAKRINDFMHEEIFIL